MPDQEPTQEEKMFTPNSEKSALTEGLNRKRLSEDGMALFGISQSPTSKNLRINTKFSRSPNTDTASYSAPIEPFASKYSCREPHSR